MNDYERFDDDELYNLKQELDCANYGNATPDAWNKFHDLINQLRKEGII